jgi:hypothetical protein
MHLTIILGSIPVMFVAPYFPPVTAVLIVLKIILDVKLQDAGTKLWQGFASNSSALTK